MLQFAKRIMAGRRPRVFLSYSHDSDTHRKRVLDLCQQLRDHGVDADIDQQGWCSRACSTDTARCVWSGGTARSYYVGIETSGPSIPGMPRPLQALCVVPQGMEEGTQTDVKSREVGLKVGQRGRFRFFSSTMRKQDEPGTYLRGWDDNELEETSPLEVELTASEGEQVVPVRFQSRITELGVFELWCKSTRSDQSWKLELNVRE